ncbi:type II secretion system protein [Candidatus Riflebacteria bacterium]
MLSHKRSFSLLELIIASFIIAIMAEVGASLFFIDQVRVQETALKKVLMETRSGIDQYFLAMKARGGVGGVGSYPKSIMDLVAHKSYATEGFFLRQIPKNPFVGAFAWEVRASTPIEVWHLTTDPTDVWASGGIFDIRYPRLASVTVDIYGKSTVVSLSSESMKSDSDWRNYYWQW